MKPSAARLFAAMEATWPPEHRRQLGPFALRQSAGGGQRVNAATVAGAFSPEDLDRAIAAMTGPGRTPIFQIDPGAQHLDTALAERGWLRHDPVVLCLAAVETLAEGAPPAPALAHWPPLVIQRDLWAEGGIADGRLAVMARAADPKAALLARAQDRAAGTAFVSADRDIAVLHALHVPPASRRQGTARNLMHTAGVWAQAAGADWLALAVTEANLAANRLYASLGMAVVARYHYRLPPQPDAAP